MKDMTLLQNQLTGWKLASSIQSFRLWLSTGLSTVYPELVQHRQVIALGSTALLLIGGLWFGLSALDAQVRLIFIVFGLAVLGWVSSVTDETYIALAAMVALSLLGVSQPEDLFLALGDSIIWLLVASFVIAAAVTASGLSERLTLVVATRVRSITQLFYALTVILLVTAFAIPATSGRAALMAPIFLALSAGIQDKRISRALALLFPTIILLSAVASLIGAGAHLVTVEILWRMAGEKISFGRWAALGLPFALTSCLVSTWVILQLFLRSEERKRPLKLETAQLTLPGHGRSTTCAKSFTLNQKFLLVVVAALALGWATEVWHGVNGALLALMGALFVTTPGLGLLSFKEGMKAVNWRLILFMAATLELGEALNRSGGAQWLVQQLFVGLQTSSSTSTLQVVVAVTLISLLAHLLITSRTARSSVLAPIVVLLGMSFGYNPVALAFLSTAAAGFCLTLPVSAKPVAMFCQLDGPTYKPRDLLQLSAVLLPIHFVLLLVFVFWVWPFFGLAL
jgi:anion transporter